jgi:hypothetical protein
VNSCYSAAAQHLQGVCRSWELPVEAHARPSCCDQVASKHLWFRVHQRQQEKWSQKEATAAAAQSVLPPCTHMGCIGLFMFDEVTLPAGHQ